MQNTASVKRQLDNHKDSLKFIRISTEKSNPNIKLAFSKDSSSSSSASVFEDTHSSNPLLNDELTRARNCVSRIADPLWQNICMDLITMMGPASVLKIWKSTLGDVSRQHKVLDIRCETPETLAFIQQYDFVILGSLQRYFPALKQLRVHIASTL